MVLAPEKGENFLDHAQHSEWRECYSTGYPGWARHADSRCQSGVLHEGAPVVVSPHGLKLRAAPQSP
jgi:hypothetical protein